jgi:hypothetical protein
MLQRIHHEGHELGIHPLKSGGVGPTERLEFAELEGYIKEVEKVLPANPDEAKYLRLIAAPRSKENNKAKIIRGLGYILLDLEVLPEVVANAKIHAGMAIPITGREDETIRWTKEILIRLDEEKLKAVTVGKYLRVEGRQGQRQTPGVNRFNWEHGPTIEWIALPRN